MTPSAQAWMTLFMEIASIISAAATEHNVELEYAFDQAMDQIERGVAAALGIELCECADHAKH